MLHGKKPAVMVGLAIGDALGMPFEKLKEEIHEGLATWTGDYQEGTFHKLPAGHWTDDTEMAVALAESLIENGGYNGAATAKKYLAWSEGTPHGMGGSTRNAMKRLKEGVSWELSGELFETTETVGSGTAMRIAPLGLAYRHRSMRNARLDAGITHNHEEAFAAAIVVASAVGSLYSLTPADDPKIFRGQVVRQILEALEDTQTANTDLYRKLGEYYTKPFASLTEGLNVGNRGNAYQIVLSALRAVILGWRGFADGIQAAIRQGGDTDTRAAIAGAMLGALHGLGGIPESYQKGVKDFEMLRDLDQKLWDLHTLPEGLSV